MKKILVALAAAGLIVWIAFGMPIPGFAPSEAQAAAVLTVADYAPLECGRVDANHNRGASYQMDGPLGMADDAQIEAWHAMTQDERIAFLEVCDG